MYIAVLDIAQEDCPVVKLTDIMKDVEVVVIGANVSEIHRGYERIYITIKGHDREDVVKAIDNISRMDYVKSFTILHRKYNEARVYMYLRKTNAMEASVKLDATPVAPWVSADGVERWILGFPSRKQLYEYVSLVREHDVVENVIVRDIPDDVITDMSLLYLVLADFVINMKGLTRSQLKILNMALNEGYYAWPRRINTIELSSKLGTSRTAVTKLLRRAEYKILKSALEVINAHRYRCKKKN